MQRAGCLRLRLIWFVSGLAVALSLVACGGGGIDESLLEGLEFDFTGVVGGSDDAPVEEVESVEDPSPFTGIGLLNLEQGFRVAYLHDMETLVDEVRESTRSMQRLGENMDTDQDGANHLEWVVAVHDMHFRSEELRYRIYRYPFTDDLTLDYVDFHADFLRGVEIYSLCADRLLESALMLGPGVSAGDLTPADYAEFQSLVGESTFYCAQAEVFNTRSGEQLREQLGLVVF